MALFCLVVFKIVSIFAFQQVIWNGDICDKRIAKVPRIPRHEVYVSPMFRFYKTFLWITVLLQSVSCRFPVQASVCVHICLPSQPSLTHLTFIQSISPLPSLWVFWEWKSTDQACVTKSHLMQGYFCSWRAQTIYHVPSIEHLPFFAVLTNGKNTFWSLEEPLWQSSRHYSSFLLDYNAQNC